MQMRPQGQKTSLPGCILPALKCLVLSPSLIFHAKGNLETAAPRNPGEDKQDDKWRLPPPHPPPSLSRYPGNAKRGG